MHFWLGSNNIRLYNRSLAELIELLYFTFLKINREQAQVIKAAKVGDTIIIHIIV